MKRIPEEKIETIRSQTDIVGLIGEYVQLTKRGRNWFGLCPFHDENSPSFSVSEDKQMFHCFGCGAGGNAITFVMDVENLSFVEAVAKLGARTGVEVEAGEAAGGERQMPPGHRKLLDAHRYAAEFYHHLLLNTVEGEEALEYLYGRGFTKETIEKFGIGWSLGNRESLVTLLRRKGFSDEEIAEAGLAIIPENGNGAFDRFRNRVMFPLHDMNGKTVGFSGRVIEKTGDEPKYLNSPESPIFNKSEILYNYHNARLAARKSGNVILFEGFMDVISADAAGVQSGVALMGTSMSDKHLSMLGRVTNEVIICTDGDHAGWEAARRFSRMFPSNRLDAKVAIVPEGLDPDDYLKKYGGEAFRENIIGQPHTLLSFSMMYAKRDKNLKNENDLLQYIHEVLEELAGKTTPVERDLYLNQLAEETGVSTEALTAQFRKSEARHTRKEKNAPPPEKRPAEPPISRGKTRKSPVARAERIILSHMLRDGTLFARFRDSGEGSPFFHDEYTAIFVRLAGFYEEYGEPDVHRFCETLDDPELRKIVMETVMDEFSGENAEEEIRDSMRHIRKYRIEMEIGEKLQQSKEAEKMSNLSRALELSKEIIALRKSLSAI
ncbi:DNA primase [Bhargavaea cecembensis]|uniref:DNA primase n=1 Tax=Bhargavaea cecembensis TaxID=394098 RepID=A0A161RIT4_9BACL|nr:DNA primase [Bhargavaea cecembensis]KZE40092.1 DNA primase [Bhargavaea cecembensis]